MNSVYDHVWEHSIYSNILCHICRILKLVGKALTFLQHYYLIVYFKVQKDYADEAKDREETESLLGGTGSHNEVHQYTNIPGKFST